MASTYSFDIVSEFDKGEMINVLDQTQREISSRYDFKGSSASIDWIDGDRNGFKLIADHKMQLDALIDTLHKKAINRNVDIRVFDETAEPIESNLKVTQIIKFRVGLDQEKAKKITNLIRENLPKVKTQIQGDTVRVTSTKKDELQQVMSLVNSADLDFATSYTNFR